MTKYSNQAVVNLEKYEQHWNLLSKVGQEKRIAGKKNRWGKKQNRLIPSNLQ